MKYMMQEFRFVDHLVQEVSRSHRQQLFTSVVCKYVESLVVECLIVAL